MIDKGYAELCIRDAPKSFIVWYLPHFGVTNLNKPGKLRVVHDAAARCDPHSLLLKGPDLSQSLMDILFRFREGKVGLVADIREMFPQVKIREVDRDAQRFLWRDTPNEPIRIYRMSSMIFGAVSSPFTAIYIKNKNATEYLSQYPDAAEAIIHNTYMDDYIGSHATIEKAAEVARDVIEVHSRAVFEIRGWVSNEPSALAFVPPNLRLKQSSTVNSSIDLGHFPQSVRTLGLIWYPDTDTLSFSNNFPKELPKRLTKRVVLSDLMRIFDPLGMLSPLTIRGRIIFQDIWRVGTGWDEELPQAIYKKWCSWYNDVLCVLNLKIPRWYLVNNHVDRRELHIFCDASRDACAAVAYWRILYSNGNVHLTLVSSKARVNPLNKVHTIPCLELQSALIAARMAHTVCKAHKYKAIQRVFWTDARNVLGWIRNDARKYQAFVSFRLGEIHELSEVSEWRWVPTSLNVADDATRSVPGELFQNSRWFNGPEFLLSSPNDWPVEPVSPTLSHIDELKPSHKLSHFINVTDIFSPVVASPDRFSSWLRLIRATASSHHFATLLINKRNFVNRIARMGNRTRPATTLTSRGIRIPLTAEELDRAENHILRHSQAFSFTEELAALRCGLPLPRGNRIGSNAVILGEGGLLRLHGRIGAAENVGRDTKTPVLLDGKDHAVRLLVLHYHQKDAHAQHDTVVNELRQKYWILKLRSTVRAVIHSCQFCRIKKAVPVRPSVGDLPQIRLAHHKRPFSYVGLDNFGPLVVTVGRHVEKRYCALYTCLTTRAIHLEVVHSLSADSAVMSLRRFMARRGTPLEILSDNGTAFIGASKLLRELYGAALFDQAANSGIRWRFIPPAAPFMGGAWERLIRSVKCALKSSLDGRRLSDEMLITLLTEAEALVNSRPLTHVHYEPDLQEALTPMHFLLGTSSGARPVETEFSDRDLVGREQWRKVQRLTDYFWARWLKEYLPSLAPRARTVGDTTPLCIGDLVLVADNNLPRGSWLKGRVSAVYPGKDGEVRIVDVETAGGTLRRASKKLVRLPIS